MTSDLYRRTLPDDPCLNVWIRAIKGPSTPLMKYAHGLKVRRICGPAMMTSLIVFLMPYVNNEVTQGRIPKPLYARDYERWMKWNLHVVCRWNGIVPNRMRRILVSLWNWGDVRKNFVVELRPI